MKKIIFTKTFIKILSKNGSIVKEDILNLITKYPNTNNLEQIDNIELNALVLKGYLLSKKIRIVILFQYVKNKFVPITIVKKESRDGYNITKKNYIELFGNLIDKSIIDIDENNFEIIEI